MDRHHIGLHWPDILLEGSAHDIVNKLLGTSGHFFCFRKNPSLILGPSLKKVKLKSYYFKAISGHVL